MIITRWQAPTFPSIDQAKIIFENEGLEPKLESYEANTKIREQKNPFGESRWILSGEMLYNIGGNQFVLRQGDRLEIPANTKHSFGVFGTVPCTTVSGYRIP
ncbi:MAG: cupin domain-containing protein [Bdellovibrionota bacterium]